MGKAVPEALREMAPTVGSLFSGIGGLDLGLERAGFKVIWQVENNLYCQKILKKHWPDVPLYDDVKKINEDTPSPFLLVGGFPCQPVSTAGKRKGQADDRWLWPEFARCIRLLRPRFVLVENVPGLLTSTQGRAAQEVFGDLATCRYDAEWDCIPASAFGAHFRGDRVFIIAKNSAPNSLRRKGKWANPIRTHWTLAEFTRLVQHELSICIPSGKSGRVSDGLPYRMDRLKGLGNAVVPQVAEWIGKQILENEFS